MQNHSCTDILADVTSPAAQNRPVLYGASQGPRVALRRYKFHKSVSLPSPLAVGIDRYMDSFFKRSQENQSTHNAEQHGRHLLQATVLSLCLICYLFFSGTAFSPH